jgi:hypothetical protein
MTTPGEHKSVQARILKYARKIAWTYVPRDEAEGRRGFNEAGSMAENRARNASLLLGDLLHYPIAGRLRVQALDLPELKSFSAEDAR